MSTFRLLIVGLGKMGRLHARKAPLSAEPLPFDDILIGTVDPHSDAHYKTIHQALGVRWDAAIIATPMEELYGCALDTLKAGIPTLVEKPCAWSVAQAQDLAMTASERGTIVCAGMIERYSPLVEVVSQMLGSIGMIQRIDSWRFGPGPALAQHRDPNRDLLIHDVDLVEFFGLRHAPAMLRGDYVEHEKRAEWVVQGTDGTAVIDWRFKQAYVWRKGEIDDLFGRVRGNGQDALETEQRAFFRAALGIEQRESTIPLPLAAIERVSR